MTKYADYNYYFEVFRGKLDKEEFDKVILQASLHVQQVTFGRANLHVNDDEVKLATCAVCDVLFEDLKQRKAGDGRIVASETNDGISVSYVKEGTANETAEETLRRKIYKTAELYLYGTGLLELGC